MDEAFAMQSVQPMIHRIVNRFAAKFHLDNSEVFQEAQLFALEAVRSCDLNKRTLCGWVCFLVTQRLYSKARHPGFRARYGFQGRVLPDLIERAHFDIESLVNEVSEDAALAVQIALSEGVPDRHYIEALLHTTYGWTHAHTMCVFNEVRGALQ